MKTKVIALVLSVVMLVLAAGCRNADKAKDVTVPTTAVSDTAVSDVTEPPESVIDVPAPEGYHLVWSDEFSGDTLNTDIWTRFTAQPGWVNNELQEYTASTDNSYIEDGKLVIQAIQTDTGYTSARLNTQGKQDVKYGRFEICAKLPEGQGLWPALWLMPTNENIYGQWPKCGEIDIMELLGSDPATMYGTVHYGDPHTSQGTTYKLGSGTFADAYHVFALEWEPDEMRFYVDGELYYTVNDWFTKVEGMDEITYPAPFDQTFYVILNLAVGGDWPGSPDATTDFANAKVLVDYVRVYQLESYDENVTKPAKGTLREADATGNYMINGDFSADEIIEDTENWCFLKFLSGEGSANISDGELVIDTTNYGSAEYSVQIVQSGLPMEEGASYKLTFDAYADEDRTMITAVTAPDLSWLRYLTDTKLDLTTEPQTFTLDFEVTTATDTNGRLEFNLGFQDSKASVHIDNVRLEKTSQTDVGEKVKSVLPDGNYVYNSAFDSGENRLGNWTVSGGEYFVTNTDFVRELMLTAGDATAEVSQNKLSLTKGSSYVLSFDARADGDASATVSVGGNEFAFDMSDKNATYKYTVVVGEESSDYILSFLFDKAHTYYLDNVRLVEDALLLNGSFINGFTVWTPFVDSTLSTAVTYIVDAQKEDNAAEFTINDTSDVDWKIQLKQESLTLENGKSYILTFDAKSDVARQIKCCFQRDGNKWTGEEPWLEYSSILLADLDTDYKTFTIEFTMSAPTDAQAMLAFSLGCIDRQITSAHKVWIDNVTLTEVTEP